LTIEQYLEIERAAEFKTEYINGEMFAMARGCVNHGMIAADTIARLHGQLRGKPCAIADSNRDC